LGKCHTTAAIPSGTGSLIQTENQARWNTLNWRERTETNKQTPNNKNTNFPTNIEPLNNFPNPNIASFTKT
jgi:hypothetical protein